MNEGGEAREMNSLKRISLEVAIVTLLLFIANYSFAKLGYLVNKKGNKGWVEIEIISERGGKDKKRVEM